MSVENFHADKLKAPEWMNSEFFSKVLQQCENDQNIKIINFETSPASMKGDHYASVMFRVKVKYAQNNQKLEKSLIIKTMPEMDGHKKDMLKESHIFETEIGMYTEIIPKFEQILRSVGDDTVLGARCLYYSLKPRKLIIFEDIVPLGYATIRDRSLQLAEVKLALLKIAKWHAISYKLLSEQPDMFEKSCYGVFSTSGMTEQEFLVSGNKLFIDFLNETPSLRQYKPYFEEIDKTLIAKCIDSFEEYKKQPLPHVPYVLCHGDFHRKNMMFKHNAKTLQLEDVMLHDFQMSFVGSQVLDVIYACYMLLDTQQRKQQFDELTYYYFDIFRQTLHKIDYKANVPKYSAFRAELERQRHFGIFLMVSFLPFWHALKLNNFINFDEMVTSSNYRRKLYDIEDFVKEMEETLPKLLHLGYFEEYKMQN